MRDASHPKSSTAISAGAALCALGLALAVGLWVQQTPKDESWGWRFAAGGLLALAAYAGALRVVLTRPVAGLGALVVVLAFAAALRVVAWVCAPDLSTDVYRYMWDGRVTNAGINPYRYAPADPHVASPGDALWKQINYKHIPTIYPPAAQVLFTGLWRLGNPELTFRLAFVLFDLATVALLLRLLRRFRRPQVWVLAYAWHPLVIVEFSAGAHVDAAGIFLLALALALMPQSGGRAVGWSAVALGLSVMTKGYALLALPFLARRYGWRYLAWVAAACAVVTIPFLGAGKALISGLAVYVEGWRENASLLLLLDRALQPFTDRSLMVAKVIMAVNVLILMIWLLAHSRNKDETVLRNTFVVLSAAVLLGGPVLPWYAAWTVPFLAFWPVAGWVLFTGLVSIGYYARWWLPDSFMLARWMAYALVYLGLAAQGAWWVSRLRRTNPAASERS